ncbi:hypothetical protein [Streptomyces sp. NPDC055085]
MNADAWQDIANRIHDLPECEWEEPAEHRDIQPNLEAAIEAAKRRHPSGKEGTPEWVPPAFVGVWESSETDLSERIKGIVRGQDPM